MSWMDTPVIQELGQYLDLAAYRQSLISSNLANIDTPGYRTRDIDFERTMRHAVANAGAPPDPPRAVEVPGLMERPDGNNVSLDRESLLLAQTQLQFRLGVELVRQQFQELTTAIKEGS